MFGAEIQNLMKRFVFFTAFFIVYPIRTKLIYVVYQTLNIILLLTKKYFPFGVSLELFWFKNRLIECQLLVTPELRQGYRGICGVVKLFLFLL